MSSATVSPNPPLGWAPMPTLAETWESVRSADSDRPATLSAEWKQAA